MIATYSDLRISRIETLWTVVGQAHGGDGDVLTAQRQLLERYGGAARRYLLAATRDVDVADELFQEFAVRFLHGRLRGATQGRGRFRDFLKGVLSHMVADHCKSARRRPLYLTPDHPEPAAQTAVSEEDVVFLTGWRDELLARSWSALEASEKESGQAYFTVLRYRADHPDDSSTEMADRLSQVLGKPVTAPAVRQILHRARERFADLLLEEIAQGLDNPTDEALEAELIDLSLLDHCRPALKRRAAGAR
jgi:RNA polymerase sigma-70 factor (ECF subfamily)